MQSLLRWNSNKYNVFFVLVTLCIQHAVRMLLIILSSVACLAKPYFSTLSLKRDDFLGGGYGTYNACFDFVYSFCLKHFLF